MKKSRNLILTLLFIWLIFPLNEVQSFSVKAASLEINGRIGSRTDGTETGKTEASTSAYASDQLASPNEKVIILDHLPKAGEHSTVQLRAVGFGLILAVFLMNRRKDKETRTEAFSSEK